MEKFANEIRAYSSCGSIADLEERVKEGISKTSLVGLIENPRKITTKKGKQMAIATL